MLQLRQVRSILIHKKEWISTSQNTFNLATRTFIVVPVTGVITVTAAIIQMIIAIHTSVTNRDNADD